jgi:predicted ATPase/DNA-binding CsgD family transcriptional regulator/Tfp pilus assembly protein PilF
MGWAALESPPAGAQRWHASGLLGREDELARIADALERSRLVTLMGAPGIGKTSLALAISEGYAEETAVVELAALTDASLIPSALASALSVPQAPGQSLTDTVLATLRPRRLLVILDNCEHLLDESARVAALLLAACPRVRVLATSREPLSIASERVWRVPPLGVPGEGEAAPEAMMAYPAVALFVERAGEVQPGFALNAFLAHDIAGICRRLDGNPLAIELAAARVGAMTPKEISRRLEDHLGLLSYRGRDGVPRHRTLASALDWSHELLSAPERSVLRRLSVFAGTFELEAATAICAGGAAAAGAVSMLLDRLVSKSLVVADADPDRPGRYRLLETVRAYAAEKLERAGATSELRTAHAAFYVSLAERAEAEFTGPRQLDWFARITVERANLRAALDWSLGQGRGEWALRLAGALVLYWRVRGPYVEGREQLLSALSAGDGAPPGLRAKALWGEGFLALMAGDETAAVPSLERSLACYRDLGDQRGCARALLILADTGQRPFDERRPATLAESVRLAREAGDHWCLAHALGLAGFDCQWQEKLDDARAMFEECLAVARGAGDLQGLRFGLIGLGAFAVDQGDYGEAESLLAEAVEVTASLGESYDQAVALTFMGALAVGRGEYRRAQSALDQALALIPDSAPPGADLEALMLLAAVAHAEGDRVRARSLLDRVLAGGRVVQGVLGLGLLAADDGDLTEARQLLEEALAAARASGRRRAIASALRALGRVMRAEGDPKRAAALLDEALCVQRDLGDLPAIAGTLEAVAGLAAGGGHHEHAARLFAAAQALREHGGYARLPWESAGCESDLALVRRSLTGAALARGASEGAALSPDQALTAALDGPHPPRAESGWASLTERELEIAQLVAEGLSNQEIAERLIIARETVKTHLSHIFAKLGVTGRWMVAREVQARNGGPPRTGSSRNGS